MFYRTKRIVKVGKYLECFLKKFMSRSIFSLPFCKFPKLKSLFVQGRVAGHSGKLSRHCSAAQVHEYSEDFQVLAIFQHFLRTCERISYQEFHKLAWIQPVKILMRPTFPRHEATKSRLRDSWFSRENILQISAMFRYRQCRVLTDVTWSHEPVAELQIPSIAIQWLVALRCAAPLKIC